MAEPSPKFITTPCKIVWDELRTLKRLVTRGRSQDALLKQIEKTEDVFCDFECSWDAHQQEHHSS